MLVKLFFHQNSDYLNFLRLWLGFFPPPRIIPVSFIMQCIMGNILMFWTDQSQCFCLRAAPSHDLSPEVCCFSKHPTSAFSAYKTTDSITACSVSLSLSLSLSQSTPSFRWVHRQTEREAQSWLVKLVISNFRPQTQIPHTHLIFMRRGPSSGTAAAQTSAHQITLI